MICHVPPLRVSLETHLRLLVPWLPGSKPEVLARHLSHTASVPLLPKATSPGGGGGREAGKKSVADMGWSGEGQGDNPPPPDHAAYLVITDL